MKAYSYSGMAIMFWDVEDGFWNEETNPEGDVFKTREDAERFAELYPANKNNRIYEFDIDTKEA